MSFKGFFKIVIIIQLSMAYSKVTHLLVPEGFELIDRTSFNSH
mgnify:CR=1 FL=1